MFLVATADLVELRRAGRCWTRAQAMNPKPVEQVRTSELALALPALRRARQRAEEIAIATNTCLVQVKTDESLKSRRTS
jgi:hypothetical protein